MTFARRLHFVFGRGRARLFAVFFTRVRIHVLHLLQVLKFVVAAVRRCWFGCSVTPPSVCLRLLCCNAQLIFDLFFQTGRQRRQEPIVLTGASNTHCRQKSAHLCCSLYRCYCFSCGLLSCLWAVKEQMEHGIQQLAGEYKLQESGTLNIQLISKKKFPLQKIRSTFLAI